jgi:hypothetical protein
MALLLAFIEDVCRPKGRKKFRWAELPFPPNTWCDPKFLVTGRELVRWKAVVHVRESREHRFFLFPSDRVRWFSLVHVWNDMVLSEFVSILLWADEKNSQK